MILGARLPLGFDKVPNCPWYRYDNRGLERPVVLEDDRVYTLEIVVDSTIATLYVDGVALNVRMYAKAGRSLDAHLAPRELAEQTPPSTARIWPVT